MSLGYEEWHPEIPVINLSSVHKRYGGTYALKDINLSIGTGEFVSLLGPSGCGKSTALGIIAGLGSPTAGHVTIMNGDSKEGRRPGDLAFVFQDATLMPWRSVEANVAVPLEMLRVSKRERRERVREVLRLVGLENVSRQLPKSLSGGMKMRVSIARALVSRPQILLMDEPFGALDEITRQNLHQELLALWQHIQMTVIFVTHNVFEAVYLSTRIVVMGSNPGRIVKTLNNPIPFPRTDIIRSSEEYMRLVAQVTGVLKGGPA